MIFNLEKEIKEFKKEFPNRMEKIFIINVNDEEQKSKVRLEFFLK